MGLDPSSSFRSTHQHGFELIPHFLQLVFGGFGSFFVDPPSVLLGFDACFDGVDLGLCRVALGLDLRHSRFEPRSIGFRQPGRRFSLGSFAFASFFGRRHRHCDLHVHDPIRPRANGHTMAVERHGPPRTSPPYVNFQVNRTVEGGLRVVNIRLTYGCSPVGGPDGPGTSYAGGATGGHVGQGPSMDREWTVERAVHEPNRGREVDDPRVTTCAMVWKKMSVRANPTRCRFHGDGARTGCHRHGIVCGCCAAGSEDGACANECDVLERKSRGHRRMRGILGANGDVDT